MGTRMTRLFTSIAMILITILLISITHGETTTSPRQTADRSIRQGKDYKKLGNYELAVEHFKEALNKYTSVKAYSYLGFTYMNMKKYPQAASSFVSAMQINPKDFYNYAGNIDIIYHVDANYEDAIAYYEMAISKEPKKADNYHHLAIFQSIFPPSRMHVPESDEIVKRYNKAIELEPNNTIFYNSLGDYYYCCYIDTIKQCKAIHYYEEAIEKDPENVIAYIHLGDFYLESDLYDKAIILYKKAIQISPQNAYPYFCLGVIFNRVGQMEDAVKFLEMGLSIDPHYIWADLYRSKIERLKTDIDKKFQKKGILTEKDKQAIEIATELCKKGELEEAINILDSTLKILEYKILSFKIERNFELNKDDMTLINKTKSFIALTLSNLGSICLDNSNHEMAESLLKRSLEVREKMSFPNYSEIAESLSKLSSLYSTTGDYEKAEILLQEVLELKLKAFDHNDIKSFKKAIKLAEFLEETIKLHGRRKRPLEFNYRCNRYYVLGKESYGRREYEEAEDLLRKALEIAEKESEPDSADIAQILYDLCLVYLDVGEHRRAEPLLKRALKIQEKTFGLENLKTLKSNKALERLYDTIDDAPSLRRAQKIRKKKLGIEDSDKVEDLNNRIHAYLEEGNFTQAILLEGEILKIREVVLGKEHPDTALSLTNLASGFLLLGDYDKAEPLLKRAQEIYENIYQEESPDMIDVLRGLGMISCAKLDYEKAENIMKRALDFSIKELGRKYPGIASIFETDLDDLLITDILQQDNLLNVSKCLNMLSIVYLDSAKYGKAKSLLEKELKVRKMIFGSEHPIMADTLANLGVLYVVLGDYEKGETLLKRCLEIYKKAQGEEKLGTAQILLNLGTLYKALGDYDKAEPLLEESLEIRESLLGGKHPETAKSLYVLALCFLEKGEIDQAIRIFEKGNVHLGLGHCYLALGDYHEALSEFSQMLGQKGIKPLEVYVGLGLTCEGLVNYPKAKEYFAKAIKMIESQRKTIGLILRETFLSGSIGGGPFSRLEPYEGMIRVLLKEKEEGYEKESLRYAEQVKSRVLLEMLTASGIRGESKVEQKILDQERGFQQRLAALRKQIEVLAELGSTAPVGKLVGVQKELDQMAEKYENFIKGVKLQNTELASLFSIDIYEVKNIQKLLKPDTTLLEYFIATNKTYAWLITRDKIKAYEIGENGKEISAKVNEFRLANMSNRSRRLTPPMMTIVIDTEQKKETTEDKRREDMVKYKELSEEFHKTLVSPIEKDIKTEKVIIVPHGSLHKIPFASLYDGNKYLIDKYSISILPAASVMQYIEKKRSPNNKRLLAFANPIADYVPGFFPLENAETEVSKISQYFSKQETYYREEATEGMAKENSSSPDVIHFACHGEFNDRQPLQSGLLLAKDDENDGYLQVHEIFGLNLENANLVTLSACETALGKIQGGDDMVGLSRGFIYAGTPSILATLWNVDDRSTSILMKQFYDNWQNKGMAKPEALRQAQLAIKSMPGYKHPYYWAAFEMIGDWQ